MKSYITLSALLFVLLFCLLTATGTIDAGKANPEDASSLEASAGPSETGGEKKLVVAYSNNIEGYLEPCG